MASDMLDSIEESNRVASVKEEQVNARLRELKEAEYLQIRLRAKVLNDRTLMANERIQMVRDRKFQTVMENAANHERKCIKIAEQSHSEQKSHWEAPLHSKLDVVRKQNEMIQAERALKVKQDLDMKAKSVLDAQNMLRLQQAQKIKAKIDRFENARAASADAIKSAEEEKLRQIIESIKSRDKRLEDISKSWSTMKDLQVTRCRLFLFLTVHAHRNSQPHHFFRSHFRSLSHYVSLYIYYICK